MVMVVLMTMIVRMIMIVGMIVRAVRMRVRGAGLIPILVEGDRRFAASAYAAHQSISISRIFNSSPAVIRTR